MENGNANKYKTILESCNRESQPYKKAAETPDKDTRGWRQAFTLIELLVVVLIIGILAAVAVPQYRLSVDRTRIANIISILRTVQEAEESYYMANGSYTLNWNQLGLPFSGNIFRSSLKLSDTLTLTLASDSSSVNRTGNAVYATDTQLPNIQIHYYYHYQLPNKLWKPGIPACYAIAPQRASNYSYQLCQKVSGKKQADTGISDYKSIFFLNK